VLNDALKGIPIRSVQQRRRVRIDRDQRVPPEDREVIDSLVRVTLGTPDVGYYPTSGAHLKSTFGVASAFSLKAIE
jgi:hypothetical protein